MILHNFTVNKYKYIKDAYFIWYQVLPKNKKYVITKTKNIIGLKNLVKILKHIKKSTNIILSKKHLETWLDYK